MDPGRAMAPSRRRASLLSPAEGGGPILPITTRPQHPDFTKIGRAPNSSGDEKRDCVVNYFLLEPRIAPLIIKSYKVGFDPELEGSREKKALLRKQVDKIGSYVFDGGSLLYSTKEGLEEDVFDGFSIKRQDDLDPLDTRVTYFYNLFLKQCQKKMGLIPIGPHFYDQTKKKQMIQHRLEVWPGFVTSTRQMEHDPLLNVDLVFRVNQMDDVFTFMKRLKAAHPHNYKTLIEETLLGGVVMTLNNNFKTYKVDGIEWGMRPTDSFKRRSDESEEITYLKYFASKGYTIKETNQPLLRSNPTKQEERRGMLGMKYLIPEMCIQTGLTDEMRGDFHLMREIAKVAHLSPQQRLEECMGVVRGMMNSADIREVCKNWGIRFNPRPREVEGRVLPRENLTFGDNRVIQVKENVDWTGEFRYNKLLDPKSLRRWAILYTGRDGEGVDAFINTLSKMAGQLGFRFLENPLKIRTTDGNLGNFMNAIDDAMGRGGGFVGLLLMVLPNNKMEVYAGVKRKCSIEYGVPSQCILAKNLRHKSLSSICSKIAIQICAKIGGQPWGLENPLQALMVVGYDVHNGKLRSSAQGYGAMVATTNKQLSSYFSKVVSMDDRNSEGTSMGSALTNCVEAYVDRNNGELPNRIMLYRDGVSEGQLNYTIETELKSIKDAIHTFYKGRGKDPPRFTFIVVTRKITTRIYQKYGGNGRRTELRNPEPGLVVDDVVTCPERYDFYLTSQTTRQGTISPTSYNVISDTSGLSPHHIQRLSYKLCHGYFNWSGTVAVPAPCQYARKLAFLTTTALQGEAHGNLVHYLHFL